MSLHPMHEGATALGLCGSVKWFDPARGFGFVIADDGGPDILLHGKVLCAFGQGTVADGSRLSMTVQQTERGIQVVEILEIEASQSAPLTMPPGLTGVDPDQIATLPLVPARVKWFDRNKGFGFANAFGHACDIFLHAEVLRASTRTELASGEAVVLRVIDGDRGMIAAQILSWDVAQAEDGQDAGQI